jgi:hypothetical protein
MSDRCKLKWILCLLGINLAPGLAQAQNVTVQGIVVDSATGERLSGAEVSIVSLRLRVVANADGRFFLIGVPQGSHVVQARYLGYNPTGYAIRTDSLKAQLVIRLQRASIQIEGLTVVGSGGGEQPVQLPTTAGQVSISPRQVETLPSLGEVDVFRGLQLLPGVSATNEGSSGLYVRGGTPSENLVLLDGMTVYHVDHFFGIFSAFNSEAIKDIQLYTAAYPAKYGGRTSAVVDLTGKTGDEHNFRASLGANLLSARGVVEVPLGRGSWLISARRSYTDIIQSPLFNKLFGARQGTQATVPQGPGGGGGGGGQFGGNFQGLQLQPSFYFYDLNSKLTYRPSGRDVVSVSGYSGRDHLDQSNDGFQLPNGTTTNIQTSDITVWGNRGASLRWFRQWGSRLSSEALVAGSRYYSDGSRSRTGSLGINGPGGTGGGGAATQNAFDEHNKVDDYSLRLDNDLKLTPWLSAGFGGNATWNAVSYQFGDPATDSASRRVARDDKGRIFAGYSQATINPGDRFELTGGLRVVGYDENATSYLEPRASASVQVLRGVRVKAAWGRYHQFVTRVENENVLQGSRDFWLLAAGDLLPSSSEHRVVGASVERGNYLVNVELYRKTLDNTTLFSTRFRQGPSIDFGSLFYTGTGLARGIDVLLQRKLGKLTGWVSYSLAEVTNQFPEIDGGAAFPASQDQRHQLKTVASYRRGPWTLSSSWIFGSGTPYTSPESEYSIRLLDGTSQGYIHVGDKNSYRLPAYHRLDLAAFRKIESRRLDWELGASVFNVYNRQNVWYRQFDLSQSPVTITDVHFLGLTPTIDVKVTLK